MPRKIIRYFRRYRSLKGNVLALSFVSLLNDTSSEIIYPLLPAFLALTLGASPFFIGLIEGFSESVSSLLKLFSGYLSDKFDRRRLPVFAGYAIVCLVRPLLAFVTSWHHVLFVRLGDRIGKGIRIAPRDAILAASVSAERRGLAFGFNRAFDHLGAVFGSVLAFVLLYFFAKDSDSPSAQDYQHVFLFASVPIVLSLFVIIFFVKEKKKARIEVAPIKLSLSEFDGNFKRFLLVIALFTLSNSTDAFLLLRAEHVGVPLPVIPLLWTALHISKVFGSLIFGGLSDKVGRRKLIFTGWVLYTLVYCGFAFVSNTWQALTLFIAYGLYFGLTEGTEKALVADLVPEEKHGTAYGFYNLAFGVTVFPASLLFGLLWANFSAQVAFLTSAGISLSAALLILTVTNSKFQKDED